jgi:hypothetical protein
VAFNLHQGAATADKSLPTLFFATTVSSDSAGVVLLCGALF